MFKSSIFLKGVIIITSILSSAGTVFAQTEDAIVAKKNSLKVNPTSFFVSTFALSYERYLSQGTTLQLTGGMMAASQDSDYNGTYYNGNTYVTSNNTDKAYGGLAEVMLKFYFLKGQSVMSGLYAAPYFRYCKNNFEIHTQSTNGTVIPVSFKYNIESFDGGGVFGFQWVIRNAFVMDMFVGGGLKISNNTAPAFYNKDDRTFWILEAQDYTGITPKAGLRLGFVF
ncbi:hypothetical protein [Cytophaga aurantiaca]|uniref:hypothetical protein n=1 Tax=Cytophaga aurantiaca TaxID=29530 RepID=UPI0003643854|nr:hypothetical protein [Cytophaga aurantiaca]